MAQNIVMPKLGNTVETVVLVEWKKNIGDTVALGEVLCEVETDKSNIEVEAETAGTLLAKLYQNDEEVPVLQPFAVIGEPGEKVSSGDSSNEFQSPESPQSPPGETNEAQNLSVPTHKAAISPRARNLAASANISRVPESGSGPGGRVIERDIKTLIDKLTPAARTLAAENPHKGSAIEGSVIEGSAIGGRISTSDIRDFNSKSIKAVETSSTSDPYETIPVQGIRQIIAERMVNSLQSTAQLTLNSSFNAASLLSWRAGFKESPEELGLSAIGINDLILFAVSRLLPRHPQLNATFHSSEIRRYQNVHLGFAVDTEKGLMVPVIRQANSLSLSKISAEAKRLAAACRDGRASPDELSGGTFTVTNLGAFGIENFTPVLNAPEVAILGIGCIVNAAVEAEDGGICLEKRMGLSLTIDHQALDGAPAARFLQDLCLMLTRLEWLMALQNHQD